MYTIHVHYYYYYNLPSFKSLTTNRKHINKSLVSSRLKLHVLTETGGREGGGAGTLGSGERGGERGEGEGG